MDVVQKLDRFGSERWRDLADIAVDEEQKIYVEEQGKRGPETQTFF